MSPRRWGLFDDFAQGRHLRAQSRCHRCVCRGNTGRGRVEYPAAFPESFSVSATDFASKKAWYSSYGEGLDVAAPGGDTQADLNNDGFPDGVLQNTLVRRQGKVTSGYEWFQGTSMAAPHVAGIAALIHSAGVHDPDEVERILHDTARHPEGKDWSPQYGHGIVDAHAARRSEQEPRLETQSSSGRNSGPSLVSASS